MTAPTHLSLGSLAYLAGCAFVDRQPQFNELGMAGVGSLLPDVDSPRSALGKVLFFVSARIERRFGHRTITHSFVGIVLLAVLTVPVVPRTGAGPWAALLIGYFAHVLGDICTKQGVQFYWPMALWGVFPMKEPYRLATGSRMEGAVLLLSLLANLAVAPVATAGTSRTLHYLNRSAYGAIEARGANLRAPQPGNAPFGCRSAATASLHRGDRFLERRDREYVPILLTVAMVRSPSVEQSTRSRWASGRLSR